MVHLLVSTGMNVKMFVQLNVFSLLNLVLLRVLFLSEFVCCCCCLLVAFSPRHLSLVFVFCVFLCSLRYRANIYKLLHMLPEFIADMERMHLCDPTFLRRYLANYDARYDFVDESAVAFVQWTLVLQVYRTRKLLATQTKSRQRRAGLAAMRNPSQAALALARFGQERKIAQDAVAVLQLLRQFYTLILNYEGDSLSIPDRASAYACRGETWRQQRDMIRAKADYQKARSIEVHQVVACTGLALCAMHQLDLNAASEACVAGFRAIRMKFLKQPATVEQIAAAPKLLANHAITLETWKTVAPFIFLQQPLLTGVAQAFSLKHAFQDNSAETMVKEQLEKETSSLSQIDKLMLSMHVRHASIMISVQALLFQHQGEPYLAEALHKVALECDRQCALSRSYAFFFELRFGSLLEALKHLRVLMKVLPYADVSTSPTLAWTYRLPSWLKESPRFWKGSYPAFLGKAGSGLGGRMKTAASLAALAASVSSHPLLMQLQEFYDRTLDNLADNDLHAALSALENACKLDVPFPLVAGIKKFYKDNMLTIMPSSALAHSMAVDENRLGLVEDSAGNLSAAASSSEDRFSRHRYLVE